LKEKQKNKKVGGDLTQINPMPQEDGLLKVVIETPKGSHNKYSFDHEENIFQLSKVLPAGMVFPYDFGFVPKTCAPDGDPVDVLVLMDEPAFPGCMVKCRLIGAIKGEQKEDGEKKRNDRLIAVEERSHVYSGVTDISDIPEQLMREICEFFVNYHELQGKKYILLGNVGAKKARGLLDQGLKAA
jgi:inorganic pyrophosphatase